MALLTWNDDYSVGDPRFDTHHKKLLDIFNEVNDLISEDYTSEALQKLIYELKAYTITHFTAEEERMVSSNYPDYADHKEKHEGFIAEVKSFEEKLNNDDMFVLDDIFLYLSQWLITHIQTEDKKYAGKI